MDELFKPFTTDPPLFCINKGAKYCDNCDAIIEKYFANKDLRVCIHCFLTIQTFAAIKRQNDKNKPRYPIIDGVEWNSPNENGDFCVTFRNKTFEYLSKEEIHAEIKRQDLREGIKSDTVTTYLNRGDDEYYDQDDYF